MTTKKRALAFAGLAIGAAAAWGCNGDDSCGPGDAPDALTVDVGELGEPVRFAGFRSSPNNDCTRSPDATSLSIEATPADGSTGFFVLCLPQPDRLGDNPVAVADEDLVQLISLSAGDLTLDPDGQPSGRISFEGFCGDGTDPAGYAMRFDATVPVRRGDQTGRATLSGRVAVTAE